MKKVLIMTAKIMIVIILWNLSLQLISGANTFANIVGVFILVWVAYLIVYFIIKSTVPSLFLTISADACPG